MGKLLMTNFKNLLYREFIISFKNTKSLYSYCTFFFTSILLFVFGIGSDISILSTIYKPILWMITIFSLILISESFVFEDFLDGSLSELQFLGYSEEVIFLSKFLVMFTSLVVPNIILIPISSILFEVNFFDVVEIITLFIISLPTISLISILSALFSLQVKRNKFIQFILIMPFFIPIIIIATSENFLVTNLGYEFKIFVLIGLFLITLPLSILIGKLIIKELNY